MSMLDKINSGYYDDVMFKEGDLLRLYKWIRFSDDLIKNLSLTDEELGILNTKTCSDMTFAEIYNIAVEIKNNNI